MASRMASLTKSSSSLAAARLERALELAPGLGLFTADEPLDDPWFVRFAVREVLPFRDKTVRGWLAEHDAGIVEVKTRGQTADALALQRSWRGRGEVPFTVFVLRCGGRKVAALCGSPYQAMKHSYADVDIIIAQGGEGGGHCGEVGSIVLWPQVVKAVSPPGCAASTSRPSGGHWSGRLGSRAASTARLKQTGRGLIGKPAPVPSPDP